MFCLNHASGPCAARCTSFSRGLARGKTKKTWTGYPRRANAGFKPCWIRSHSSASTQHHQCLGTSPPPNCDARGIFRRHVFAHLPPSPRSRERHVPSRQAGRCGPTTKRRFSGARRRSTATRGTTSPASCQGGRKMRSRTTGESVVPSPLSPVTQAGSNCWKLS